MFSVGRSARRRRSRAERPSWQGARINEILERHVPRHQTTFYCRNATFQGIKPHFIAGTRRSKASNPFLSPERDVPRHQTLFYRRNATFQGTKPLFIAGTPRSKAPNPFLLPERHVPRHQTLFYCRNATFQGIKPLFYRRNAAFRNLEP